MKSVESLNNIFKKNNINDIKTNKSSSKTTYSNELVMFVQKLSNCKSFESLMAFDKAVEHNLSVAEFILNSTFERYENNKRIKQNMISFSSEAYDFYENVFDKSTEGIDFKGMIEAVKNFASKAKQFAIEKVKWTREFFVKVIENLKAKIAKLKTSRQNVALSTKEADMYAFTPEFCNNPKKVVRDLYYDAYYKDDMHVKVNVDDFKSKMINAIYKNGGKKMKTTVGVALQLDDIDEENPSTTIGIIEKYIKKAERAQKDLEDIFKDIAKQIEKIEAGDGDGQNKKKAATWAKITKIATFGKAGSEETLTEEYEQVIKNTKVELQNMKTLATVLSEAVQRYGAGLTKVLPVSDSSNKEEK